MENKKPKRSLNYMIPIVMAVMMAFGLYLGKSFTAVQPIELSKGQANYQKIKDIVEILDQQYVDEVDAEKLFEQTIGDILHNLDPHSNYISAQDIHAMNEQIEGKFGGVGVRFFIVTRFVLRECFQVHLLNERD
jgi:carboxyl-terminal processing protease